MRNVSINVCDMLSAQGNDHSWLTGEKFNREAKQCRAQGLITWLMFTSIGMRLGSVFLSDDKHASWTRASAGNVFSVRFIWLNIEELTPIIGLVRQHAGKGMATALEKHIMPRNCATSPGRVSSSLGSRWHS